MSAINSGVFSTASSALQLRAAPLPTLVIIARDASDTPCLRFVHGVRYDAASGLVSPNSHLLAEAHVQSLRGLHPETRFHLEYSQACVAKPAQPVSAAISEANSLLSQRELSLPDVFASKFRIMMRPMALAFYMADQQSEPLGVHVRFDGNVMPALAWETKRLLDIAHEETQRSILTANKYGLEIDRHLLVARCGKKTFYFGLSMHCLVSAVLLIEDGKPRVLHPDACPVLLASS